MTKLVRNRELEEYRKEKLQKFEKKAMGEATQLTSKYIVDTSELIDIDRYDLLKWSKECINYEYPLDKLYENKGLFDKILHS